jgi:hypothetical protein
MADHYSALERWIAAAVKARAEQLEADLARAVILQHPDRLSHLHVVHGYHVAPTVASTWPAPCDPALGDNLEADLRR